MSNTADTERSSAGVSFGGRTHENVLCGESMVGDVQAAAPMVTDDGETSAPKFEPETEEKKV